MLIAAFFAMDIEAQLQDKGKIEQPFFPLMAWDDVQDEATIKKMADCGINMIAFTPPRLLNACEQYGVKAIIYDERILPVYSQPFKAEAANPVLKELIKKYNDHPALFGYHLKDEPPPDEFDELGESVALVNKLAPGKWAYINMLPTIVYPNFEEVYLNPFIEKCRPMYLSYDRYSITEGDKYLLDNGFWQNLSVVRAAALKNKIPFHSIILTAAHFNYRIPSLDDLALQVYGALAYGAQGLGFYKFVGESLNILQADELGNWRYAPLDEFHDITPSYYNLRLLNKRIQKMAPVLMNLRSDDVYHIGKDSLIEDNHGVRAHSYVKGEQTGHSFLIGEYTHLHDGSKWMMIVNKDLKASAFCHYLTFSDEVDMSSIKVLSHATGELKNWSRFYSLAPGQGALLKFNLKK